MTKRERILKGDKWKYKDLSIFYLSDTQLLHKKTSCISDQLHGTAMEVSDTKIEIADVYCNDFVRRRVDYTIPLSDITFVEEEE